MSRQDRIKKVMSEGRQLHEEEGFPLEVTVVVHGGLTFKKLVTSSTKWDNLMDELAKKYGHGGFDFTTKSQQ